MYRQVGLEEPRKLVLAQWPDAPVVVDYRFLARILDPALLSVRLADMGARLMGASWKPPTTQQALNLTFNDLEGQPLQFPPGCLERPMKRVLCNQAHLAMEEAAKQGWPQISFEDFWTEGEDYLEKVNAWVTS